MYGELEGHVSSPGFHSFDMCHFVLLKLAGDFRSI
eukprot:Gb_12504 [translate_table: standard]